MLMLTPSLSETLIVLIQKVENLVLLEDSRAISLCNVAYKLISKVLVLRLRPFLNGIIGPFQGSFIPRRGTLDNNILTQEVVHYIHNSNLKSGVLAINVYLQKAYARVNWDFLKKTLHSFRFPMRFINFIMWGVTGSSLSILWNSTKIDTFSPFRGLKQGDPISIYMFVL